MNKQQHTNDMLTALNESLEELAKTGFDRFSTLCAQFIDEIADTIDQFENTKTDYLNEDTEYLGGFFDFEHEPCTTHDAYEPSQLATD